MAAMAATEQTQTFCYRHPKNETAVACSNCGRPICTECMVFAAVGIKCPECAGQPTGMKRAATRARTSAAQGRTDLVTRGLIGVCVAVFVLQIAQAGNINGRPEEFAANDIWVRGSLVGGFIAEGEWWRLVTSAFIHASPIHLLFNMLMLWWFGSALEALLGRVRFLGIFFVSVLGGSAGALLATEPNQLTVGASGAVFGILGAGVVLERRQIMVFGGGALGVVVLNLALTFLIPGISIGGHIGGLAGGAAATFALSRFGRGHAAYGRLGVEGVVGLLAVAVLSVAVAYFRVRGYT
jgi:membrane associated rhomboid family serine protease